MGQPNFHKYKGVLPTSGIKKTILAESWRDPTNSQGWNIPLVMDTGSVMYNKASYEANSHTGLHKSINSNRARQSTHDKGLDSQKLETLRGLSTIGIKTYHIKRKWWETQ